MNAMDKGAMPPATKIVLRPSCDDDVPAMLPVYRRHIARGVGDLRAFRPTPTT